MTLDASKQLIDEHALKAFSDAASGADLAGAFEQLVTGAKVNITEERAALHTLLRGTGAGELPALTNEIDETLSRMRAATEAIHSGSHVGASGQRFTDVINIGIGGSDLGPRMVCRALDEVSAQLNTHFISNVDPHDLDVVTRGLTRKPRSWSFAPKPSQPRKRSPMRSGRGLGLLMVGFRRPR